MSLEIDLFLIMGQFPGLDAAGALRAASDYTVAAEAAGFDGVWLAEHHFITYGVCPSAVALAAYLLGRTSKIMVGTAAAILSTRHPVALTEEAILLDVVSGGRFGLGVARGGEWVDLEVFGTGRARHASGFPESLDLLLQGLRGDGRIHGPGPQFRFREVPLVPPPLGTVPVWVAATTKDTADVAARRGLPLLLGMHDDAHAKRRMLDDYAVTAAATGHDPGRMAHGSAHLTYVTDSGTADIRARLLGLLDRTREYQRLVPIAAADRDLEAYADHLLRIHPVGPAQLCVERLLSVIAATGVRRLLLMVEAAGSPAATLRMIDRLAAEVLPAVRSSHGDDDLSASLS